MQAHTAYIYIRGEFVNEARRLQAAIDEAYDAVLGKDAANLVNHSIFTCIEVAGAYICGEETALLESLEGRKGQPRLKPPFPAGVGLYGCPTCVNNVESIAVAPTILRRGAGGFWSWENNTVPSCFAFSHMLTNPVMLKKKWAFPLRELLEKHAGGVRGGWDNLLAVIPGGCQRR